MKDLKRHRNSDNEKEEMMKGSKVEMNTHNFDKHIFVRLKISFPLRYLKITSTTTQHNTHNKPTTQ